MLRCFKAYDIRGRVPDELNEDIATRIGRAFAERLSPGTVVVGEDMRLSSPTLADAVSRGLNAGGADVLRIGMCGTEEVYFATSHLKAGGGIMVTASHNPADWNGMKLVREGSRPISGDSGLAEIGALAEANRFQPVDRPGSMSHASSFAAYLEHLLGYVDVAALRPLKIVVNAGNGGAGHVIDGLESRLPFEFVKIHHEADGSFPHGVPNPLLPENRRPTRDAVRAAGADFGIAWDGDFDRCFLFDERGEFIEGYYIVGLLAEAILGRSQPGSRVIHDPRLTWNTIDIVERHGGKPVQSKTGHAFIKERMRAEDAIYGGEMSAHHYFRDFAYCDSGMIPWLLVAGLLSATGKPLSALVAERMAAYPCSGEINRQVGDPQAALQRVRECYSAQALTIDEIDGLSLEFSDWRFNLRQSNTEPLIRLNVESRGDAGMVEVRTAEVLGVIEGGGG
ncbi:MAG: phosphomannomutase [Gammaproteobacteria bacterium PRO9]|nr:phosphomannomutase [Gammaproteobacteria bacterium PRO9]